MVLERLNLHVSSLSCMFLQSEDVFYMDVALNRGGTSPIKKPESSPQNLPFGIFSPQENYFSVLSVITERKKEKPEITMTVMAMVHMTDSAFVCLELTSNSQ